ncbi:MAG: FkbM family methyltransferase, partial [Alphaproteobacteria bacterium]|nr:FkbM family methyltransferase [Alphaproteobacteria bacterium]
VTSKMDFDGNQKTRQEFSGRYFWIETINPTELLRRFNAPQRIEYLSLDVEGCEIEVLRALDFNNYQIALMSVEHSEVPERQHQIRSHLIPLGYQFYERFYDDWFFHPRYLAQIQLPNETFDHSRAFQHVRDTFLVS